MDVNEVLAIGGTSGTLAGGTLWGFVKMWYKQKEEISILKRDIHHLKNKCQEVILELSEIEKEINGKHEVLSEKFNHLELQIEKNKNEIIKEIHELINKK